MGGRVVEHELTCYDGLLWARRSTKAYERVFMEAGLNVVRSEVQLGLPAELFVVRMWALR